MKKIISGSVILGLSFVMAGCTFVKTTDDGENVALVKPMHVQKCKKLGSTTSQVKDSVAFIARRDKDVTLELVNLAKNEAAKMGGDTITAKGEAVEGRQAFDIYNCK